MSQWKLTDNERVEDDKIRTTITYTTVHHHTHLALKVDIRFESGEDLNNV